ncbi:MAG TPA: hypothetical protein ENH29_07790 [Bacteroidetes bacterium]|nr:hypothetical protein [Bacteroidota bacterium]
MKHLNLVIGICLLIFGAVLLVINLGVNPISLKILWPGFPILIGVLFLSFYFTEKGKTGFIMPGVILVFVGAASFVCTLTSWDNMRYLWPVFILSPGLGFLWAYLAGSREQFQLIWGIVLTLISVIFFFVRSGLEILWPVIVILIGLIFIFLHVARRGETSAEAAISQATGEENQAAADD